MKYSFRGSPGFNERSSERSGQEGCTITAPRSLCCRAALSRGKGRLHAIGKGRLRGSGPNCILKTLLLIPAAYPVISPEIRPACRYASTPCYKSACRRGSDETAFFLTKSLRENGHAFFVRVAQELTSSSSRARSYRPCASVAAGAYHPPTWSRCRCGG